MQSCMCYVQTHYYAAPGLKAMMCHKPYLTIALCDQKYTISCGDHQLSYTILLGLSSSHTELAVTWIYVILLLSVSGFIFMSYSSIV